MIGRLEHNLSLTPFANKVPLWRPASGLNVQLKQSGQTRTEPQLGCYRPLDDGDADALALADSSAASCELSQLPTS